jgi:hypothetical protein
MVASVLVVAATRPALLIVQVRIAAASVALVAGGAAAAIVEQLPVSSGRPAFSKYSVADEAVPSTTDIS